MKYGCCTTIGNYELLVKNGYDRITLPAAELASMDIPAFERLSEALSNGNVKCRALNSFCTPRLVLCGNGYRIDAVEAYSKVLAGRAAQIGVKYIGVGAPKSRSLSPDFQRSLAMAQFRQSLTEICGACARYGIEVLLEAVCELECNFITTTDEAAAVIEDAGIDNLNLVFDTYHAFMMGENDKPLRRALKYVKLVHAAQNIDGRRHYLRRANLAEYQVYFNALLDGGYNGEVDIEAFYDDPEAYLGDTIELMKILCSRSEH